VLPDHTTRPIDIRAGFAIGEDQGVVLRKLRCEVGDDSEDGANHRQVVLRSRESRGNRVRGRIEAREN
jgi:hypothetical protein